jgi:hypothetical protein
MAFTQGEEGNVSEPSIFLAIKWGTGAASTTMGISYRNRGAFSTSLS